MNAALEHVSAASLRGNVSFLASDLLEGRATPSRGLDIAAEYIAAQFRHAGLAPGGDNGTYFQKAVITERECDPDIPHCKDQPRVTPFTSRNVVGVLRGADPGLKNTYVLVTAHYDHLGTDPALKGDRIYNGANDDASGAASVIEVASALATLTPHPARSIVFIAFFGEETGFEGSTYYLRHPLFPVDRTVADINLEQLGRTDATEGPEVNTASPTGYGYTSLTDTLAAAGRLTGITVRKGEGTDRYFYASDNLPFAQAGIPAQTICVAFQFSDYHGVGDEAGKLDYKNMARVDRMLALAVDMAANAPAPPVWNTADPHTKPFAGARGTAR